ncbi:hormone-sensitive lipase [Onthophagus taurus]|uniref:hormone-sensitive lipase n=1 Tax=Onthophagus taurus TaxID=166361 RepID=UPI0039BE075D
MEIMTDLRFEESNSSTTSSIEDKITRDSLVELCKNNASYFVNDTTENGQRLYTSFLAIVDNIDEICPIVLNLKSVVSKYDFDEKTPANGYRSFLQLIDFAITYGIQLNKKICVKRDSVLFRKAYFTKEAEACAQLFASLLSCLNLLNIIREHSEETSLFTLEHLNSDQETSLLYNIDKVNQYCFYGRCLGFQFCESMKGALRFITLSMAIFSEAYYSEGSIISKATSSFKNTTKYITDPEEKAKRLVNISKNADIDFCKSFWFLSEGELMKHLPTIVAQSVCVSKVIHIPTEPLTLQYGSRIVNVPVPTSHIGRKAVQVRLISWRRREGMIGEGTNRLDPPCRGLFVHCHGGGFVAQSSRSHECYLRQWAKDIDIPILSIDYSLAPQAPYPRALEEVLYAYCWALNKCHLLGSTGERIVVGGDSAGANLLASMTLKCLELGIRKPDGVFMAYAPVSISFQASPARLLCVMDPLLPFGFLMRCIKAYTLPDPSKINGLETNNGNSDTESFEEITESDLMDLQAHKSPVSDASDTLTYASLSSPPEEKQNGANDVQSSQKYVSEFLEKYALDSDTDTDLTKVPESQSQTSTPNVSTDGGAIAMQNRVAAFVSNLRGRIESFVPSLGSSSGASLYLDAVKETNLYDDLKFTIPKDMYISPYYAPENILMEMPPVKIMTVHMDPCLDDCVMFARKLKKCGVDVSLDVLGGLPHGFLNFNMISKEAYDASKLCTQKILDLFDMENLPNETQ